MMDSTPSDPKRGARRPDDAVTPLRLENISGDLVWSYGLLHMPSGATVRIDDAEDMDALEAALNAVLAPPAPTEPEERAATSMYQQDVARLEAERDEANRLVGAHRAMTIDANKALRDVLLAALGVEDDGKTPLAAYVASVIAQRDEARAEVARLRAEAVANREREHGPSGPWAKFILARAALGPQPSGTTLAGWHEIGQVHDEWGYQHPLDRHPKELGSRTRAARIAGLSGVPLLTRTVTSYPDGTTVIAPWQEAEQ